MNINELPKDFFLEIENNENFLGRVTLNIDRGKFTTEIAIVQRESKKIFQYIDTISGYEDPREILDQSVLVIGKYLKNLKSD